MDELSGEDTLRLNVLLHSDPVAIRIDESAMVIHGLSERGEAQVPLHPNCRDDLYLRRVRELISGHVLGSPGGYPVYLKRWTRMGQAREGSLDQLLLLGEPEAVVAVVHAHGLTDEQASRAWWAMPTADNARSMLARDDIVTGTMGKILADYLVEYLPVEHEGAAADGVPRSRPTKIRGDAVVIRYAGAVGGGRENIDPIPGSALLVPATRRKGCIFADFCPR